MRDVQRIGIVAAGVAVALWLFVVVSVVATPASAGVNFAPLTIGLPATAVALVAAVLLIVSVPDVVVRAAAMISVASWIALLYRLFSNRAPVDIVDLALLIAAISSLGGSAARATKASLRGGLR